MGQKRFELIRILTDELFQILDNSSNKDPVDIHWSPHMVGDPNQTIHVQWPPSATTTTSDVPDAFGVYASREISPTNAFTVDPSNEAPMEQW